MTPRRLGQHFLKDTLVAARIASAAELAASDTVVEVGPGRGALTRRLVGKVRCLVLVELDSELASRLKAKYRDEDSVQVVEADARVFEPGDFDGLKDVPYKMVGNLPYYAANPIIRRFLESRHPPRLMVVMVQREVARGMTALPGEMGLLSVAVQLYANPRKVCDVPPRAFVPPPKVHSTVVRLDVLDKPAVDGVSIEAFFDVVRAGFSAPRKQIRNSLANGLHVPADEAARLLAAAGIDGARRPATLSLSEWNALCRAFERCSGAVA